MVNLGFFVFNILPIPPLDGSRVIYALAPEPVQRGMEVIEQYGIILVFAIVLLSFTIFWHFYAQRDPVLLCDFCRQFLALLIDESGQRYNNNVPSRRGVKIS